MAFTKFTDRTIRLVGTSKIRFADDTELSSVTDMAAGSVSEDAIAKADSNGALVDSIISDDGSEATVDGDLAVTGDTAITGALTVASHPVASGVQAAHINDPSGSVTDQDDEARAAIVSILNALEAFGIVAAA